MTRLPLRAAPTAALFLAALSACHRSPASNPAPAPSAPPVQVSYTKGEDVLAAMRTRYDGKWYKTLTFKQKTSRLTPDGKWNVQTWYEAMKIPGSLRIDFDPLSGGNGVIYARDSAFTVNGGRALRGSPSINPLLLLGFDVYGNTPARSAAILRKEGFNLALVHPDTFQGRPMIVVGARAGDTHTKQFWIDAERLYFVRTLEPTPRDPTKVQDVRFVNYRPEGDAWIAPRVEIHSDGKLVFFEDYSDIRTNVDLSDDLFDPSKWKTVKHWVVP
jgi:hypothetical protein